MNLYSKYNDSDSCTVRCFSFNEDKYVEVVCVMQLFCWQDLSFEELKGKLTRSARLAELRQSLSRFDASAAKLKALEEKRKTLEIPQLKKFQAIQIEVPTR